MEDHLIQKTYYMEKFSLEDSGEHPVNILGELYYEEQKKDVADLSYIRFAQGEVYFLNKDYESAIFKWENIHNELEPWAKKNMADAYFELDLLQSAEEIYQSITTDSMVLNMEIALQLFSLYIEENKLAEADQMIKNAVILNPDYPNVTKLALAFFEEKEDWASAVELTANEAIRTKSANWFNRLKSYIESGKANSYDPVYFIPALKVLLEVDFRQFEQMTHSLWAAYNSHPSYLLWLGELNHLILHTDLDENYNWHELSGFYNESFIGLLSGKYTIHDLEEIMPHLLMAWQKVANKSAVVFASSALLAWSDVFPNRIENDAVQSAQVILADAPYMDNLIEGSSELYESIKSWASRRGISISKKLDWMIQEVAHSGSRHVLIAGSTDGKSVIFNPLTGTADHSIPRLVKYAPESEQQLITDEGIYPVSSPDHLSELHTQDAILKYSLPNDVLGKYHLTLIDWPDEYFPANSEDDRLLIGPRLAESIVYVLDETAPFTSKERAGINKLKEIFPNCPIHFVLLISGAVRNEEELLEIVEGTKGRIESILPASKLITIFEEFDASVNLEKINRLLSVLTARQQNDLRIKNFLFYIRQTLQYLFDQKIKAEQELDDSIQAEEGILGKIQGSIHQLYDIEEEKTKVIVDAYRALKEEIKKDLSNTVPQLIKDSAEIIRENSDFGTIHLTLNEEMNKRIANYLEETVHPIFIHSLQDWIDYCEVELHQAQETLIEWTDSFNALFGEERIQLACDFQILSDWKRDADRMTSSIQIDKENILLKRTPAQVLLKGAGKIFGVIPANNTMMYNRYKSYIENEDYKEIVESITNKYFSQFELFEKAIPRDLSLFFREPFVKLKDTVGQLELSIDRQKNALDEMKSNPESFHDPLKLFKVRLRQIEWISMANEDPSLTIQSGY